MNSSNDRENVLKTYKCHSEIITRWLDLWYKLIFSDSLYKKLRYFNQQLNFKAAIKLISNT